MATLVYKSCRLYVGGHDFSGDANQLALDYSAEDKDVTTFDSAGARKRVAGLLDVTGSAHVFLDPSAGATGREKFLFDQVGSTSGVFTVAVSDTDGERCFACQAIHASYQPLAGAVGDVLASDVAFSGDSELVRATILHPGGTARTATVNGTGRQLGSVSATQKLYAALHVVSASVADTLDVKIQSDDNSGFTTPTDRITFAQQTATGAVWATPVAGAIADDWWRAVLTIGGTDPSFKAAAAVGIK